MERLHDVNASLIVAEHDGQVFFAMIIPRNKVLNPEAQGQAGAVCCFELS